MHDTLDNAVETFVYRDGLNPVAWQRVVGSGTPDRKSTRLNSSHIPLSRMPSSA